MIRVENGKVVAPELSYDGVLSQKMLKNYNHIKYKKLFEEVVDTMAMNLIVHTFYQENLKYSVNEKLEFIVLCQDRRESENDTEIFTFDRIYYDNYLSACEDLLHKFRTSWNKLSEVEKYILKGLYFDDEKMTDEEMIDALVTYKNKYQNCKTSAYVKMDKSLKVDNPLVQDNLDNEAIIDNLKFITLIRNEDNWDTQKKKDVVKKEEK